MVGKWSPNPKSKCTWAFRVWAAGLGGEEVSPGAQQWPLGTEVGPARWAFVRCGIPARGSRTLGLHQGPSDPHGSPQMRGRQGAMCLGRSVWDWHPVSLSTSSVQ